MAKKYVSKIVKGSTDIYIKDADAWAELSNKLDSSLKGSANGVAELDENGMVPSTQLPSYIDDVIDLLAITDTAPATCQKGDLYFNTTTSKVVRATATNTWGTGPTTNTDPEKGKIYVNLTNDKCYRWSGSAMVKISSSDVIGIKVGASGSTITPIQGVITIPEYEQGAQVHIAPTTAEVKSALNTVTTSQGKYLKDDGTWDTPPDTTYVFNTTYDATTNKAATMSDVPDVSGKEDKVAVEAVASGTSSVSLQIERYYNIVGSVNTLTLTLPSVTDTTYLHAIGVFFTTGTGTPTVTITPQSGDTVSYFSGYAIEASKSYELNIMWNGTKWIVAYAVVE